MHAKDTKEQLYLCHWLIFFYLIFGLVWGQVRTLRALVDRKENPFICKPSGVNSLRAYLLQKGILSQCSHYLLGVSRYLGQGAWYPLAWWIGLGDILTLLTLWCLLSCMNWFLLVFGEYLLCTQALLHFIFITIVFCKDEGEEVERGKVQGHTDYWKSRSNCLTLELKVLITMLPVFHSLFKIWRLLLSIPIMKYVPLRLNS